MDNTKKAEPKIILDTLYVCTIVEDGVQNSHVRSFVLTELLDELGIPRTIYKALKDKLRHQEAKNFGVVKASQTGIWETHNGKEYLFRKF